MRGARCDRSGRKSGEGSAAPGPKIATVERREAGVPRQGTQGASQAPGVSEHAERVPRKHPTFFRRSAHPSFRVREAKGKPRAQKRAAGTRSRRQGFGGPTCPPKLRRRRENEEVLT